VVRPRKQTVDFFPHQCSHGKTLFILEQRFGDKGYCFWFKLLEWLGKSDGHCIDFSAVEDREFFLSHARVDENIFEEIMALLAKLNAIDQELWEQDSRVWSDNFVEGVKAAYDKRTTPMPSKPCLKAVFEEKSTANDSFRGENGVSGGVYPQSRGTESRVDESRKEERQKTIAVLPFSGKYVPDKDNKNLLRLQHDPAIYRAYEKLYKAIGRYYEKEKKNAWFDKLQVELFDQVGSGRAASWLQDKIASCINKLAQKNGITPQNTIQKASWEYFIKAIHRDMQTFVNDYRKTEYG